MQNIERRVATLEAEARAGGGSIKVVVVEDGETEADALKRAGYPANAADVWCVVFVSATDAKL